MYASEMRNNATPYAFGEELSWLRNTARDCTYAVMIGAGPAVMGLALMEGNPQLNLLILDNDTIFYARSHLDEAGFPTVGYRVYDSAEYGKDYAGPKLDLLLVDGDHSKKGVLRDIKAWFRHVRPGGLIFFHDYENINDDPNNGVAEAVATAKMEADDIDTPGISIVYRKRG